MILNFALNKAVMTEAEKRIKQLETRLKDGNASTVIDTITSLRSEEPCTGAIRLLADLYSCSTNSLIRKRVQEFMNDMKESSLRGEVIEEIRRKNRPETTRMLVSSCWQSGLDYSHYASDFAMIFNSGDYETAIECFTVIEGCAPHITRKSKDHIIIILKENSDIGSPDKSALMKELISVLS